MLGSGKEPDVWQSCKATALVLAQHVCIMIEIIANQNCLQRSTASSAEKVRVTKIARSLVASSVTFHLHLFILTQKPFHITKAQGCQLSLQVTWLTRRSMYSPLSASLYVTCLPTPLVISEQLTTTVPPPTHSVRSAHSYDATVLTYNALLVSQRNSTNPAHKNLMLTRSKVIRPPPQPTSLSPCRLLFPISPPSFLSSPVRSSPPPTRSPVLDAANPLPAHPPHWCSSPTSSSSSTVPS
jgi:hypothetical protein